jgi:hypothetical protein
MEFHPATGAVYGPPDDVLDRFSNLLLIERFVLDFTPGLTPQERVLIRRLFVSPRAQMTCMPAGLDVRSRDTLRGLVLRALATGWGPGRAAL